MVIEKNAGHIAFQFEAEEEFFELGAKVLNKQRIETMLPCIHVQYNMKDRLLYDVEQYIPLEEAKEELEEKDTFFILYELLKLLEEVGSNGFVPLEAIQPGADMIFWEAQKKKAYFIVLPIAKEYGNGEHKSWNKRLSDTLNELCANLPDEKAETITQNLVKPGKIADIIAGLMPVLDSFIAEIQKQENTHVQTRHKELQLLHDGTYGQFAFYIRKKEFIIGKRRDSVDGYLGVSDAVSRLHCRIIYREDCFLVSDMGSSNHTFINGTLVKAQEEKKLAEGDRLRIADVDFKVRIVDI